MTTERMHNQTDVVLQQLRGGPITSLDMIRNFGITRLAACILLLREEGFDIRTEIITVKDRWGRDCHVAQYTIKGRKRRRSPRLARAAGAKRGRPIPNTRPRATQRSRMKGRA